MSSNTSKYEPNKEKITAVVLTSCIDTPLATLGDMVPSNENANSPNLSILFPLLVAMPTNQSIIL